MAAVHVAQQPPSSRPPQHSPFRRAHRSSALAKHKSSSSTSGVPTVTSGTASSSLGVSAGPGGVPQQQQQQQQQQQAASNAHSHAQTRSSSSRTHMTVDTYYGHEETAKICARFVSHTFSCPESLPTPPPPPSTPARSSSSSSSSSASAAAQQQQQAPPNIPATLAHFVAYALHRTRLHASVTFTALALLHRLKTRFPAARGSSGHRLFLSAFMIASKVCCDDTYSNKSWAVVGQGMFALREVNQMEREMCAYLDWQLNVPREDLELFEYEVKRIYSRPGPYTVGITIKLIHGVGGAHASTGPYVPNEFTAPPPVMQNNNKQQQPQSQQSQAVVAPTQQKTTTTTTQKERLPASPTGASQLPTPTESGGAAAFPPPAVPEKPHLAVDTQLGGAPHLSSSSRGQAHQSNYFHAQHHAHTAHPRIPTTKPILPSPPTSPEDEDENNGNGNGNGNGGLRRHHTSGNGLGSGSPSPASSDEPDLPTPPSSAGTTAGSVQAYGKLGKSFSLPGFAAAGFGSAPIAPIMGNAMMGSVGGGNGAAMHQQQQQMHQHYNNPSMNSMNALTTMNNLAGLNSHNLTGNPMNNNMMNGNMNNMNMNMTIQVHRATVPPMPNVPGMPGYESSSPVKESAESSGSEDEDEEDGEELGAREGRRGMGMEDGEEDAEMVFLDSAVNGGEDKLIGTAYYANVLPVRGSGATKSSSSASGGRPSFTSSSSSAATNGRRDPRERKERERERRTLRAYTVPCMW